jgi:hypothetical protein
MSRTYEQCSGNLYDTNNALMGMGYSGRPPHRNDPSSEGVKDIGPIPRGHYTMRELVPSHNELGPDVIVLEPDLATRLYIIALGRDPDTFRIHGDAIEHPGLASNGCIIQSRLVRMRLWQSLDHEIDVVDRLPVDDGEVA